MRLRLAILILTFALTLVACTASLPKTIVLDLSGRTESFAYTAAHTYQVETWQGWGSGWAWDEDTIVTNKHVVFDPYPLEDMPEILIHQGNVTWVVTHVEYIDGIDVALLDVRGPPLRAPIKRPGWVKVGELVSIGGHPFGSPEPVVTWGWVCGRWFWKDMLVDGAIIPGMSGGPVFDDNNLLVGMCVATTTPPGRALGIVIHLSDIIDGVRNDTLDELDAGTEGVPVG